MSSLPGNLHLSGLSFLPSLLLAISSTKIVCQSLLLFRTKLFSGCLSEEEFPSPAKWELQGASLLLDHRGRRRWPEGQEQNGGELRVEMLQECLGRSNCDWPCSLQLHGDPCGLWQSICTELRASWCGTNLMTGTEFPAFQSGSWKGRCMREPGHLSSWQLKHVKTNCSFSCHWEWT